MGGWVPDTRAPYAALRSERDLPAGVRGFLRGSSEAPILELYGPQPLRTSAFAARLARFARDALPERRADPVWLAVGATDVVAPERLLLRLLEATLRGDPATVLSDLLAAEPEGLREGLISKCRAHIQQDRRVVVLDGVPDGAPGAELLRLGQQVVADTGSRLIAVSDGAHEDTGESWSRHEVEAAGATALPRPLDGAERRLLAAVERWEGDEFDATVADALCSDREGPRVTSMGLRALSAHGHLQQTREGWYRHARPRPGLDGMDLDRSLARAVLDGTVDPHPAADAYVDLLVRLWSRHAGAARTLLGRLEPYLITQQGRFRLLRARQTLWGTTGSWDLLRVTAAVAARETGEPLRALEALQEARHPRDVQEQAVTLRHLGKLPEALDTLDALDQRPFRRRRPDGWALLTRCAIQCDQGRLQGAERLLRRAVEAHQVSGDVRGEAWTVHQYGRLRLIRGDVEEAHKLLEDARNRFDGIGDLQGLAWTATEFGKAALVRGDATEAVAGLAAAVGLHHANGDVRGRAWTYLYLAVAQSLGGDAVEARRLLRIAHLHFSDLTDLLGLAWAEHYGLLLPWEAVWGKVTLKGVLPAAPTDFHHLGCPHGEAWSLLEHTARMRPEATFMAHERHALAQRLFESLDDPSGLYWTEKTDPADPVRTPAPIPLTARLTIPEPGTHFDHGTLSLTTHSHVRLTLLDDRSAAGTVSRIALRVLPGPEHPWSDRAAGLPWLTARATPLTGADVEPAHAVTLRPSPREADAAEFLFTPRRAGRHRLLFTIEHLETATVLQEVETYIDVVEGDGDGPRAGLTPESLRRP
ncbi:tetratricopeptide repeat protein [Streptomyces sp. PmtG]